MDKCTKTLKVKLYPTNTQAKTLEYMGSLCRHVYNWGLARRQEVYEATGKGLTYNQQSGELTAYKQANRWLYDVYADCLQQTLRDLDRAYKNFFEGRTRYPRFKSKHRTQPKLRFTKDVVLERTRIKIPKLGWVRVRNSHDLTKVKSVTIKRTPTGEWFATCVCEHVTQYPQPITTVCGIDLGLKDFAVITDGINYEHIKPPKYFREYERKLAHAQKALARKQKGSKNRAKAKLEVAKLHKRVANLRKNWLHQLSNRLTNEYDLICLEDLSIKGMARTTLAKSVLDAALGEFVGQLEYKTQWRGKHVQKVSRWFPSSKLCRECGVVNSELTLSERTWTCVCGATHDRDCNAATNVLLEGVSLLSGSDSPALDLWRTGKTSLVSTVL